MPDYSVELTQNGQDVAHRGAIGGVAAGVSHTQDALSIYDEVAAQLSRVTLNASQSATRAQQAYVNPQCLQLPRAQVGALTSVGTVDCALRVEQQLERGPGFFQPDAGSPHLAKGNEQHFGVQPPELILMLAQLCHVLSADQSPQVAQEDQ